VVTEGEVLIVSGRLLQASAEALVKALQPKVVFSNGI